MDFHLTDEQIGFTPTSLDALNNHLDRAAEAGYAVDNEEFIVGVRCVATALKDMVGPPVAAIGVSAPATRLSTERCVKLGDIVCRIGEQASRAMAYGARMAKAGRE